MIITPKQRYIIVFVQEKFPFSFQNTDVLLAWVEGQECILICSSVPIFYWTLHRRVNTLSVCPRPLIPHRLQMHTVHTRNQQLHENYTNYQ